MECTELNRFQDFIPLPAWDEGERNSREVDVSNITVPLAYFAHRNDNLCEWAQFDRFEKDIRAHHTVYNFGDENGGFLGGVHA